MAVKPIPDGYHSITPQLTVKDGAKAIEFYKKAFGAQEMMRMAGPDGRLMHAELKIGNSPFMLADEMPEQGCRATRRWRASRSRISCRRKRSTRW